MAELTNNQAAVVIDSMETLPLRMLDAFWCLTNNSMTITSPDRMRAVLRLLADEVETWAPSYLESKICHLAVTEVAHRLRVEAGDVAMFGRQSSAERYVLLWNEEHGPNLGEGISRSSDPKAQLYRVTVEFKGMRPMREWLRATSEAEAAKFAANRYPTNTNITVDPNNNDKRSR